MIMASIVKVIHKLFYMGHLFLSKKFFEGKEIRWVTREKEIKANEKHRKKARKH
jgi:hypothetical protein